MSGRSIPSPILGFSLHDSPVTAIESFFNDVDREFYVASGDEKGEVFLWHLNSGQMISRLPPFNSKIMTMKALFLDQTHLFVQSGDGLIHVFVLEDSNMLTFKMETVMFTFEKSFFEMDCCRTYRAKALLTSVDINNQNQMNLSLYQNRMFDCINQFVQQPNLGIITASVLKAMYKTPDNNTNRYFLTIGYEAGNMRTVIFQFVNDDIEDTLIELYQWLDIPTNCPFVTSIAYSHILDDSFNIYCTSSAAYLGRVHVVINQDKGLILADISDIATESDGTNCVQVRADNRMLAVIGWDKLFRLFSLRTGRLLATVNCCNSPVSRIHYITPVDHLNMPATARQLVPGFILLAGTESGFLTAWDLFNP